MAKRDIIGFSMKNGKHIDDNENSWYYKNNKLHREDGPAYENSNGFKIWYLNDKLHREDGPAIEHSNGNKEWWYYDNLAKNKEEFYNDKWRKEILMDLV